MTDPATFTLETEEDTIALASQIALSLKPGMIVGLSGDLGAGKSVFVRATAVALGVRERMPSPTYTIVEEYVLDNCTFMHIDLYRLGSPEEFYLLGLEESLSQSISLIEWVDRVPELLDAADIHIRLDVDHDRESLRRATVTTRKTEQPNG